MNTVDQFSGDYAFLSNFAACFVKLDGVEYPTVEHAYQAAKTLNLDDRAVVAKCKTPGGAKRIGRTLTIRPDWDELKLSVMEDLVRQKFAQFPFRGWLVMTGNSTLIEGNDWGDTFWGVCRGQGQNRLGKILMEVRSEIFRTIKQLTELKETMDGKQDGPAGA